MKYILAVFCSVFSLISFAQKRPTVIGFQNSDRYDQRNVLRVNDSLRDVPMLDTFQYTRSLGVFEQSSLSDAKFIQSIRDKYLALFFGSNKFESSIGKNKFYISPLASGAYAIFSADTAHDKRIFVVMNPYCYFIIRNGMVWIYYTSYDDIHIVGLSDANRDLLETRQAKLLKKLLYGTKKISLLVD